MNQSIIGTNADTSNFFFPINKGLQCFICCFLTSIFNKTLAAEALPQFIMPLQARFNPVLHCMDQKKLGCDKPYINITPGLLPTSFEPM